MGQIVMMTGVKGGATKSTTAINISTMLALEGKSVLLYDLDQQQSAQGWAARRHANNVEPMLRCQSGYILSYDKEEIRQKGNMLMRDLREEAKRHDVVVVDGGGGDNPALRFGLRVANIAVIPVIYSQFDVWAFAKLHEIMMSIESLRDGEAGELRAIVFPACVGQFDIQDALREPLLPPSYRGYDTPKIAVGQRKIFRDSVAEGKAVAEIVSPSGRVRDPKAVKEMGDVYHAIFGRAWSITKTTRQAA